MWAKVLAALVGEDVQVLRGLSVRGPGGQRTGEGWAGTLVGVGTDVDGGLGLSLHEKGQLRGPGGLSCPYSGACVCTGPIFIPWPGDRWPPVVDM